MDEVFLRFLHLAEQVFEPLDDGSLMSSRLVARSWKNFIHVFRQLFDLVKGRYCLKYKYGIVIHINWEYQPY